MRKFTRGDRVVEDSTGDEWEVTSVRGGAVTCEWFEGGVAMVKVLDAAWLTLVEDGICEQET